MEYATEDKKSWTDFEYPWLAGTLYGIIIMHIS